MPSAGDLRDRYTFQRRLAGEVVGGFNREGGWGAEAPDAYTCGAKTHWLKGTEPVQASRLQGDQPAIITVRRSAAALAIDNTWRAVDARQPDRVLEVVSAALNVDINFVDVLAVQRRGNAGG